MTFHVFFSSFSIIISFSVSAEEVKDMSNLAAITRILDVQDLYEKVSPEEPHLTQGTALDDETKKSLCLSMTKNAYFDLYVEEDPVEDMNLIYDQLTARAKYLREKYRRPDAYFEKVLRENYVIGKDGNPVFTYRSHSIFTGGKRREYAFPCFTRMRDNGNHYLYFVSETAYNINSALDVPTNEEIQTRFLFCPLSLTCVPSILAEEPAIVFAPPEYTTEILEDTYLQIRKSRFVAKRKEEDPLCGLNGSGKLRTCASVMNSSYFSQKVRFNPDPAYFNNKCSLGKVSFLSEKARKTVGNIPYVEWMMSCSVSSTTDPEKVYTYRLSRAHESHHVWMYEYNKEDNAWIIANISSKISVIIDDGGLTLEEGEIPHSNLFDLLIKYRSNTEEETSQS